MVAWGPAVTETSSGGTRCLFVLAVLLTQLMAFARWDFLFFSFVCLGVSEKPPPPSPPLIYTFGISLAIRRG